MIKKVWTKSIIFCIDLSMKAFVKKSAKRKKLAEYYLKSFYQNVMEAFGQQN